MAVEGIIIFCSVQFSRSVMSNTLQPHGLQHTRLSCPSPTPGARNDRGVLLVFSSCNASVRFLTRCDGKLREPFVWHQGIQVSMRMARGSASLLSRYDMGIGPQDTLKQDSQGLSRVAAGNPGFRRLLPVTLGSFSGCL